MSLSRNRLYGLLTFACIAGYAWICLNLKFHFYEMKSKLYVCMIRQVTGIPCPSCGATRSAVSVLEGHPLHALYLNPLGYLILLIITVVPFWLAYDFTKRKNTLYDFYLKAELLFMKKTIAISAIALLLLNWCWNIYKGF